METNRTEIRSGWRPLFGALKVASVGNAECVESAPLLEVFRVFLATDNTLVFANAALDCILCLLKHVRGSGELETPLSEADGHNVSYAAFAILAELAGLGEVRHSGFWWIQLVV